MGQYYAFMSMKEDGRTFLYNMPSMSKAWEIAQNCDSLLAIVYLLEKERGNPVALVGDYNDPDYNIPEKWTWEGASCKTSHRKIDWIETTVYTSESFDSIYRKILPKKKADRDPIALVNPFLREYVTLPDSEEDFQLLVRTGLLPSVVEEGTRRSYAAILLAKMSVPLIAFSSDGGGGDLDFEGDPLLDDRTLELYLNCGRWAFCPVVMVFDGEDFNNKFFKSLEKSGFIDVTYLAMRILDASGCFWLQEDVQKDEMKAIADRMKKRFFETYSNYYNMLKKGNLPGIPGFLLRALKEPWRSVIEHNLIDEWMMKFLPSIPVALWRLHGDISLLLTKKPPRWKEFALEVGKAAGMIEDAAAYLRCIIKKGMGNLPTVKEARRNGIVLDMIEAM